MDVDIRKRYFSHVPLKQGVFVSANLQREFLLGRETVSVGAAGKSVQGFCGAKREYAYGLFDGAWDLIVNSERTGVCQDQGGWCSCPGTPITGPDD